MKIRLTRKFSYQVSPRKVITHERGEIVDLPERYALAALRQRAGVRVGKASANPKKGAPENKVRKDAENKTGVGKKAKRSRSSGSKS